MKKSLQNTSIYKKKKHNLSDRRKRGHTTKKY